MSQIKISDVTNQDKNKKKFATDQTVNKIKKRVDSKIFPKPIEPKIKEKKIVPVYMNAPFKTNPPKTYSRPTSCVLQSNITPRSVQLDNINKSVQEQKTSFLISDKSEKGLDSKKINQLEKASIKKKITLAKVAPDLNLPNSILNLLHQNNKYRYQVFNSLEEKRKKVPKKHSFIRKIEGYNSENNSELLENNALVAMKNCFHEANCIINQIQNKLKILDDSRIVKLILVFNF